MDLTSRSQKRWPYAASSTGAYRAPMTIGLPLIGVEMHRWDAVGEARAVFMTELRKEIRDYLMENSRLPECGSDFWISLFMIGKSAERTKPTVMFVSDDKAARREAFRLIKGSGILRRHEGFEVGHMSPNDEFKDIRRLGRENESVTAQSGLPISLSNISVATYPGSGYRCVSVRPNQGESKSAQSPVRSATVGVSSSFRDTVLLLTVNHIFEEESVRNIQAKKDTEDSGDECEITGFDTFSDGEHTDDFINMTSGGSVTPRSELSGSVCMEDDNQASILSSESTVDVAEGVDALRSRLEALRYEEPESSEPKPPKPRRSKPTPLRLGNISVCSRTLDSAFIETTPEALESLGRVVEEAAIPLENFRLHVEAAPRDAPITIATHTGHLVWGNLSGTPSEFRLSGSGDFQELWVARMNRPLKLGDCGAVARDANTGKIFGHVIMGSISSGLAMIVPAIQVFAHALEELSRGVQAPETMPAQPSPRICLDPVIEHMEQTPPPPLTDGNSATGSTSRSGSSSSTWRILSKRFNRARTCPKEKKGAFICPFCSVWDIAVHFTGKEDLRQHFADFHCLNELWICGHKMCHAIFDIKKAYHSHIVEAHAGVGCSLDPDVVKIRTCPQVIFGCGFSHCKLILEARCDDDAETVALDYFNHVLGHLDDGSGVTGQDWSFSVEFRNLMRQSKVNDSWKKWKKMAPESPAWEVASSMVLRKLLDTRHIQDSELSLFMEWVVRCASAGYGQHQPRLPRQFCVPLDDQCHFTNDRHTTLSTGRSVVDTRERGREPTLIPQSAVDSQLRTVQLAVTEAPENLLANDVTSTELPPSLLPDIQLANTTPSHLHLSGTQDTPQSETATFHSPGTSPASIPNVPTPCPAITPFKMAPNDIAPQTSTANGHHDPHEQHHRQIWIVTGPAGSGKSTVAKHLVAHLGFTYIEGDEFHPKANIDKMSAGIPLTDADRWDWLTALREESMRQIAASHNGVVLACSAPKRKYRDVIRVAPYFNTGVHLHFVYLHAPEEVLRARVATGQNHYMGANMVQSHFHILEPPLPDEDDVISIDVSRPMDDVLCDALKRVRQTIELCLTPISLGEDKEAKQALRTSAPTGLSLPHDRSPGSSGAPRTPSLVPTGAAKLRG